MPVNGKLHISLVIATCVTTFFAYYVLFDGGGGSTVDKAWASGAFSFTVMLILGSHEMGHFLMARHHGVDSSWPYFIPIPLGFGTLGAVIRLRGQIPTRDALVDIGAAGPLAGLLIAVPMLFAGVWLSHPLVMPDDISSGVPPTLSLLNLAMLTGEHLKHLLLGGPEVAFPLYDVFGDNLLTWLAVRLVHGELPAGTDLVAHPVFLAAWFGLVMTMLNLMPVGQLDGGHLTYAWYGKEAENIGERVTAATLVFALFFSVSWLMWFVLVTRFIGLGHPPVVREAEPLSRGRKVVVIITWIMTALTFMPVPLSMI